MTLPYTTGTVSGSSGGSALTFSGGTNLIANAAVGHLIWTPDGPSGLYVSHGIQSVDSATAATIFPNLANDLSGDDFMIVPAAGMSAQAVALLSALLANSTLSDLAALSPADGDFLEYFTSGGLTNRTSLQVVTQLLSSAAEVNVASASTANIGAAASPKVQITGTTTITSFGTTANCIRFIRFAGALTLTHNATSLILKGAASRVTAANDTGIYASDGSGNWREMSYQRASSDPGDYATKTNSTDMTIHTVTVGLGAGSISTNTASGRSALAANTTGDYNTANGYNTLAANTTGSFNTASGYNALAFNTTGDYNTASGRSALVVNTTGSYNTVSGYNTLADLNITTNDGTGANTAIGYNTGRGIVTGVNNTIIGANVTGLSSSLSGTIILATGAGTQRIKADSSGHVLPGADNTQNLGSASFRYATVYAGTGTINTSDTRDKQWRGVLSAAELVAGKQMCAEIGGFQFLSSIAEKGTDSARVHFGVRAQKIRDILVANNLMDADVTTSKYAFLCYDEWPETPEIPAQDAIPAVLAEDGVTVLQPAMDAIPAVPAIPAGNRWGIRPDELIYFLLVIMDARLTALEVA